MIKLCNISKIYGEVKALDDINLEFNSNGLVFIVGESGNGKTTLLNMIGLLDNPTSGDVYINDLNIVELKNIEKSKIIKSVFGYVFQEPIFDINLNVLDNTLIPLGSTNFNQDKYYDLAKKLGVYELLNRNIDELSGGQKQRIQILRTILSNPSIILADEPTGNLDSNLKDDIFKIFKELSKDHLVIIVSHDIDAAKTYANRIIEIHNGKIVSDIANRKTNYIIENVNYNRKELVEYIDTLSDNISLDISKTYDNDTETKINEINYIDNFNTSRQFINKYTKKLFLNNKFVVSINLIISIILSTISIFLLFISFTSCKYTKNKYLDNNFYDNYILYKDTSYRSITYDVYSKEIYSGRNMYNELSEKSLIVEPLISTYMYIGNSGINIYAKTNNDLALDEIYISDYIAYKYKFNLGDILNIEDKEYKISKIIPTEFEKYRDIILSDNLSLKVIKDNIINFNLKYVVLNYQNIKSTELRLSCSNFCLNKNLTKNQSNFVSIKSANDYNMDLENNEIIITSRFARNNNINSPDKKYYFKNIRELEFNDYFDNVVCLYDYYKDGFVIKDIVEDESCDYIISDELYDNIINDYDLYERPAFYHVKNNEKLKDLNYEFKEFNMDVFKQKQEELDKIKPVLIMSIIIITFILLLFDLIYIYNFIEKNKRNIGLFKAFGYNNKTIKKCFSKFFIINELIIFILSLILYTICYFKFENMQMNSMYYNKIWMDKYNVIVFVLLIAFILMFEIVRSISFLLVYKKNPIYLLKKNK